MPAFGPFADALGPRRDGPRLAGNVDGERHPLAVSVSRDEHISATRPADLHHQFGGQVRGDEFGGSAGKTRPAAANQAGRDQNAAVPRLSRRDQLTVCG
jgi:hypothetical protein